MEHRRTRLLGKQRLLLGLLQRQLLQQQAQVGAPGELPALARLAAATPKNRPSTAAAAATMVNSSGGQCRQHTRFGTAKSRCSFACGNKVCGNKVPPCQRVCVCHIRRRLAVWLFPSGCSADGRHLTSTQHIQCHPSAHNYLTLPHITPHHLT